LRISKFKRASVRFQTSCGLVNLQRLPSGGIARRSTAHICGIRFVRCGKSWGYERCAHKHGSVLTRLREATARIARLLGIWAMHNALRTREGGQHYDCTAQICRKRARPLAMRQTSSIAAKAVGNRARGSIAAIHRTSSNATARSAHCDASSTSLYAHAT